MNAALSASPLQHTVAMRLDQTDLPSNSDVRSANLNLAEPEVKPLASMANATHLKNVSSSALASLSNAPAVLLVIFAVAILFFYRSRDKCRGYAKISSAPDAYATVGHTPIPKKKARTTSACGGTADKCQRARPLTAVDIEWAAAKQNRNHRPQIIAQI